MKTKISPRIAYSIIGFLLGFLISLTIIILSLLFFKIQIKNIFSSISHFTIPIVCGLTTLVVMNILGKRKEKQLETHKHIKENFKNLLNVNYSLMTSIDLDIVLQTIIDKSTEIVNLDTGAIYLLNNEKLFLGATTPPLPKDFPEFLRHDSLENHPNIRTSLESKKHIIIDDTSKTSLSDAEQAIVKARGLRSILYIPLVIDKRPVGVMILGTTKQLRSFSKNDIDLFSTFTGQAALSIENAKLFSETLSLNEELSQSNEELIAMNEKLKETNARMEEMNEELFIAKEKALLSEENYKKLFETNTDGISISKLNLDGTVGKIIEMNESAAKILGYSKSEIINHYPFELELHTNEDIVKERISQIQKNGEAVFETTLRNKNGAEILAEVKAILFKYNNEPAILNIARDITERKKNELELIKAKEKAEESERLKSSFLQNMSHEIRTPLNSIVGFSERICSPNVPNDKKNLFADIISSSSFQLLSIVSDILTISSLETKQEYLSVDTKSVNKMLDEIFELFLPQAQCKSIELKLNKHLSENDIVISTDFTKLNQILSNLISNAIKFTQKGYVEFGYEKKNSLLEFFVKDTGIGIAEDKQEIIFERFAQADESIKFDYGGTGLGLSICKGFLEILGGKIWVQSSINIGSTFFFSIPHTPVYNVLGSIKIKNEINQISEKTILVAEDQNFNYIYLETVLIDLNCKVIHAKNGHEAVDICKENSKINLVLMDIKMPILDGYSATKIIKEFNPNIPIVAQTAYAAAKEIEKFKDVFDDYITKPITSEKISEILKKHLY